VAKLSGFAVLLLPVTIAHAGSVQRAQHGTHSSGITKTTAQSEATAVSSADWMSNSSASIGNGSWTFTSTGLPPTDFVAPDYAVPSNPQSVSASGATVHSSSSILQDQNYSYTLPLTPEYSKTKTSTNLGPIGVALDGAVFFNPYEANDTTVATKDNFIATSGDLSASFLDNCDGHPGPHGQYHYHGLPACLADYAAGESVAAVQSVTSTSGKTTPGVSTTTAAAQEPVLLGFAFDGYGIYDNIAMNGATIHVSKLDSCNGIFSAVPGYPQGVYHYVLENVKTKRSDIGCYHGVVSSAYTAALQAMFGGASESSSVGAVSSAISGSSAVRQTASSLAANPNQETYLRALMDSKPIGSDDSRSSS
jgi:hypothetical protein